MPGEQPPRQGRGRQHQDDGHEHPRNPVRQALDGGLARLRGRHHPADPRQRRPLAHGRGPHQQDAGGVDRRPGDGLPGLDLDGHGLPGEQRGVHSRAALDDDAVGGHLLTRPHEEQVPGSQVLDADALLGAGGLRAGRAVLVEDVDGVVAARRRGEDHAGDLLSAELQQSAQSVAGAVLGARLRVAARQEEGGHPGGRLEVHVGGMPLGTGQQLHAHAHADVPGPAEHQRPQAPAGRGDHPQGHERVHGEGPVAQRPEGRLVEGPGTPDRHRQRHERHHPLPARYLEGRHHGDRHDRHRQDEAVDEPQAQVGGPLHVRGAQSRPGGLRRRGRPRRCGRGHW